MAEAFLDLATGPTDPDMRDRTDCGSQEVVGLGQDRKLFESCTVEEPKDNTGLEWRGRCFWA